MKIKRRTVLQALGMASVYGAVSTPTFAASTLVSARKSRILLNTGLRSDTAFMQAIKPDATLLFNGTVQDFQKLGDSLLALEHCHIFALVEPASSILIEEAVREAGGRVQIQMPVAQQLNKHHTLEEHDWAAQVGEVLLSDQLSDLSHFEGGGTYIALKLSV